MANAESYELAESDLFRPKITGENQLRMASSLLVAEYERFAGRKLDNLDRFIPAYAAYLLWTQSGKVMETRKIGPISKPSQAWGRAEEMGLSKGRDFVGSTRNFIHHLANNPNVGKGIQYWATKCIS